MDSGCVMGGQRAKVSKAHRDLKPENILLFGPELLAKLGEPWASEGWKWKTP